MNELVRHYDRLASVRRSFTVALLCLLGIVDVVAETPIIFQFAPQWSEFTTPFEPLGPRGTTVSTSFRYEPLWLPSDSDDRIVRTWMDNSGTYAGDHGGIGVVHTWRFDEVRAENLGPDIAVENEGRDAILAANGAIGPAVFRISGAIGRGTRDSLVLGFSSQSRIGRFGYTYRQTSDTIPFSLRAAEFPVLSPADTERRYAAHTLDYNKEGLSFLFGTGIGQTEQTSRSYRLSLTTASYWVRIEAMQEFFGIEAVAGYFDSALHVRSGETHYGDVEQLWGGGGHLGLSIPVTDALDLSGDATYIFAELVPPNYVWTVPFLPGGSWYYYRVRNIDGRAMGFISGIGLDYEHNIVSSSSDIHGRIGFHVAPFLMRSRARAETALMYPSTLPRYSDTELYQVELDGALARIQLGLVVKYGRLTFDVGATQWVPLYVDQTMTDVTASEDPSRQSEDSDHASLANMIWAGTQFSVSLQLNW